MTKQATNGMPVRQARNQRVETFDPSILAQQRVADGLTYYNVEAIRQQRDAVNWGQIAVGKKAGVSRDVVEWVYNGKQSVNLINLWKVTQAIGMAWADVFKGATRDDGLFVVTDEETRSGPKTEGCLTLKEPQEIASNLCLYNVGTFRAQRVALGMGERLMARRASLSGDSVRNVYAGRNKMMIETLWCLAIAAGIRWSDVFSGSKRKDGLFVIPRKDDSFMPALATVRKTAS